MGAERDTCTRSKSLPYNEVVIGWVYFQLLPQPKAQTHIWRKIRRKAGRLGMEGNQLSEPVIGNSVGGRGEAVR